MQSLTCDLDLISEQLATCYDNESLNRLVSHIFRLNHMHLY